LDKAKFPRVKPCAGWITPKVLEVLGLRPGDYPHTISAFRRGVISSQGNSFVTSYDEPISYGIIRQEFDQFLVNRAVSAGARFMDDASVASLNCKEKEVEVTSKDGRSFVSKMVIGAGGSRCPVRAKWGGNAERKKLVLAMESETWLGSNALAELAKGPETVELFPENDFYGYGWYVTKGDWLNIGIGRIKMAGHHLQDSLRAFMDQLRNQGRLRGIENKLNPFIGHSYSLFDRGSVKTHGERFVLVGDAAGLATEWAGEGIRPAVESAAIASQVIHEGLVKNDLGEKQLAPYTRLVKAAFDSPLNRLVRGIDSRMSDNWRARLCRWFCGSDTLRRKLVFEGAFLGASR
jgi:flavin-dependent dehydrogenase